MRLAYNLLLFALLLFAFPLLLLGLLTSARLRSGLGERCRPLEPAERDCTWVHAASVGEAQAASPLIAALLRAGHAVRATTLTLSGRERLRSLHPDIPVRLAPLDLPGLVDLSLRRARVRTLVLVETELWPNLVFAAHAQGARIVLVSGRISDASLPSYRKARALFGGVLERLSAVGARSIEDMERLVSVGLPAARCSVTGDLKLAGGTPAPASAELRSAIGSGPFLLGGSTHPGEELALLSAQRRLRAGPAPELRLLLAPRHLERVPALIEELRGQGVDVGLRSAGASEAEVALVDTVGELASLYPLASLVFVGGSLAPVGGHNLLEPVLAGRVVVHGPHVENQRSQLEMLRPFGALHPVDRADDLANVLEALWSNPDRDDPALMARSALDPDATLKRTLELVVGARAHA